MRFLPAAVAAVAFAAPAFGAEVVPVPQFHSVQLHGGGVVTVVPGPTERVTIVEGSSQYTRMRVEREGRLRIDTCDVRCPQMYRLRVEIQSPFVPGASMEIYARPRGVGPLRENRSCGRSNDVEVSRFS